MINLGDKVRDKFTGFEGRVVARTVFINGCVQYEIVPRIKKGDKYPECISIDEQHLQLIAPIKKKKPKKKPTGGPTRIGALRRSW